MVETSALQSPDPMSLQVLGPSKFCGVELPCCPGAHSDMSFAWPSAGFFMGEFVFQRSFLCLIMLCKKEAVKGMVEKLLAGDSSNLCYLHLSSEAVCLAFQDTLNKQSKGARKHC